MVSLRFWRILRFWRQLCRYTSGSCPRAILEGVLQIKGAAESTLAESCTGLEKVTVLFCLYIVHSVPSNSEDQPKPGDRLASSAARGQQEDVCWDIFSKCQGRWAELICRVQWSYAHESRPHAPFWCLWKLHCSKPHTEMPALKAPRQLSHRVGWEGSYSLSERLRDLHLLVQTCTELMKEAEHSPGAIFSALNK